jgi:pimeloyl-ACP methyl ester carboxylesterase
MAVIEASDGVALYAESTDPGDTGAARGTLLFSCAYSTTHENWRPQVAPLVAAGYRVALWDYRGHGLSGVPERADAYTMEQVVDDLGRVIDWATPGEAVILAGLSFGGLASLHFALHDPSRVRALVLAASGPGFKNPEAAAEWKSRSERTADFIESRGMEAFVGGKAASTCIGSDPSLPAAKAAAAAIGAQDPSGVARFGRHVAGLAPSVIDRLPEIEQPALVIVGERDKAYLRAADVMAGKLPAARHEVVPGAGHIVNIEAEAAFNALVLGFVDSLPLG